MQALWDVAAWAALVVTILGVRSDKYRNALFMIGAVVLAAYAQWNLHDTALALLQALIATAALWQIRISQGSSGAKAFTAAYAFLFAMIFWMAYFIGTIHTFLKSYAPAEHLLSLVTAVGLIQLIRPLGALGRIGISLCIAFAGISIVTMHAGELGPNDLLIYAGALSVLTGLLVLPHKLGFLLMVIGAGFLVVYNAIHGSWVFFTLNLVFLLLNMVSYRSEPSLEVSNQWKAKPTSE